MNLPHSSGGAAAASGVNFYRGTGREAECRAVVVVPGGGRYPWVGLVGLEGLTVGRQTLQTGQDSEARGGGGRWKEGDRRAVAAEAGGAERNRLEQPRAAVKRSSPLGTAGRRPAHSPDGVSGLGSAWRDERCIRRDGGSDAPGRGADVQTKNTELRRGLHALGGLGRSKGAGPGAALPKAGEGCRRRG